MTLPPSEYKFKKSEFQLTPIGGVDQIGSNCTIFETAEDYIIIDYGILFPNDGFFNINYLIPNYNFIKTDKKIKLVITHGHEDHIGGIHHLLSNIKIDEVYAPKFAAELIIKKKISGKENIKIKTFGRNDILSFNLVNIIPVYVNHSIPDTYGLIIQSKQELFDLLFISDFKMNNSPIIGQEFELKKIQQYFSQQRPSFFFLDSTNASSPNKTKEEVELLPDLESIIQTNKKTFITLFASNIERIGNIFSICKKYQKNVFVIGKSIENYIEVAQSTGELNSKIKIHKLEELPAGNYDHKKCVFLVSGCQGDFYSALTRLANEMVKEVKVEEGDQIVFSSKIIPGNEKNIFHLYNTFTKLGGHIIDAKDQLIHASGHASQEDLKSILNEFCPDYYFPIHGETFLLKKHSEFIQANFPTIKTSVISNFDTIRLLKNKKLEIESTEILEPILIHGKNVEISKETLKERRKVAQNGLILLILDRSYNFHFLETIGLVTPPEFSTSKIKSVIKSIKSSHSPKKDLERFKEELRIKTRRLYYNSTGIKPITKIYINDHN